MRRATLIFNPRAGRQRDLPPLISSLIQTFADHGVRAEALETSGPATAGILAARAAASGSEIVFACGGDGTVHEVLQGLVTTEAILGIIPIGTANALARSLKISGDPLQAAAQQANAASVRIAVGQASYNGPSGANRNQESRRYFTVMVGGRPGRGPRSQPADTTQVFPRPHRLLRSRRPPLPHQELPSLSRQLPPARLR